MIGATMRHAALSALLLALPACSVRRMAINYIGDALAEAGTTFTADDDPELIAAALPFGLKLYESLLAESPRHRGLLLATARGYTQYAQGFLAEESFRIEPDDLKRSRELKRRVHKLCLRGRGYALRGLELRHEDIAARLQRDVDEALGETDERDLDFLYWAGASWAAALAADKGDMELLADLPTAAALIQRVLSLDEAYGEGAAHEFMVRYEAGRSGGSMESAEAHYRRALELSGGRRATVHVGYAEAVMVERQDLAGFRRLIELALKIDPDRFPENRLVNTIARRRALLLKERTADLFIDAPEDD